MELLFISFFAGILTILAPCVLPLLPVILGGSIGATSRMRPLIVAVSLSISVFLFTLLLKGITLFISIPNSFWQFLSGMILLIMGISLIFPELWYKITEILRFEKSQHAYIQFTDKEGVGGAILLGAALGPVFSTCSPTYGIIIATVLPSNFVEGMLYLLIYCVGLTIPMLAIGYGGRAIAGKLRSASNPKGPLKRTLGVLLAIVGIAVITGLDKRFESFILDTGYMGPIEIEQQFLPSKE